MHLLQTPYEQRRVVVGCITFQVSITVSLQRISYFVIHFAIHLRFPKSDELLKRWSLAIGTEKKITGSSRICSRHFKEDDFRYSLVGGKRYLKREAIPSLYLNEENKDDTVSNNQDTIVKENQPTNTVIKYSKTTTRNITLNIIEACIKAERDDRLSKR